MIIAACLIAIIGLFLYLFFPILKLYRRIDEASRWKKTSAKVLDARVIRNKGLFSRFINPKTFFYCQFTVNGRRFGSSSVSLFNGESAQSRSKVNALKAGDEVPLFYDPESPHINCTLAPEEHSTGMMVFSRLILFIAALLVALTIVKGAL